MAEGMAKAQGLEKEDVLNNMVRYSPVRRLVPMDDIASAAVYFASDESMTVTGTVLSVDSGVAIVDASVAGFDPHAGMR
jgi:3-hydroxybutyrate dehydrogenase